MRIDLETENNLELRVCLALITGQPTEITNIAPVNGGITSYQMSLLELFSKITNGATYDVNETGCRLRVIPGTLIGGEIEHDCDNEAAIGYYAQYLILLSLFCQKPLEAVLNGVTNKRGSLSIESINNGLKNFVEEMAGKASTFSLDLVKRGAYPNGGGMVEFKSRPVQSLKPLNRTKIGKICKLRGVSWTTRLNPTIGKRLIDGAKKQFRDFLSDMYIRLDHSAKEKSGLSPGYGVSLVATTVEGAAYTIDVVSRCAAEYDGEPDVPETIGKAAVEELNEAIVRGGIVGKEMEPLLLTMMALGQHHVSKAVLGMPGALTRQVLQDLVTFTGVKFNVAPVKPGSEAYRAGTAQELLVACKGCGIVNLNRSIR